MLVAALALSFAPPPKTWFGPATATFRVEFAGNPYDPAENDVRVRFTGPTGDPIERIAFYDEGESAWKAVLVTPASGRYQARLIRNGAEKLEPAEEGLLEVTEPLKSGFLRRDPERTNRFRWDDGTPYVPLGFNLGWQNGDLPPMTEQIAKAAKSGVNWTRIWANAWDRKNPWWPQDDPQAPLTELWPGALAKWETLTEACDKNGVAFQMVLFHHGAFSSKVNPNWPDHPWNAAKGGFLKDAADFFTDAEAKRRAKMWLRYAVARWGHSPSVMAWELFNEVEWTDARYAERWTDIESWHGEMADYLRSLDPYEHLVTTSSAMDRKGLWTKMDFLQPHLYSPTVFATVSGAERSTEKPLFYGEVGADDMAKADPRTVLRDGILGGLFGNQAGPGQFWYWDVVEKSNLYSEFEVAAKVMATSEWVKHPTARAITLRSEGSTRVTALADTEWALVRVTGSSGALVGLPFSDGAHGLSTIDLDSGKVTPGTIRVAGGKATVEVGKDTVLVIRKRP